MATFISIIAVLISVSALMISGLNHMRTVRLSFAQRCEEVRSSIGVARLKLIELREHVKNFSGDLGDAQEHLSSLISRLEPMEKQIAESMDQAGVIWWLPKFTAIETRLETIASSASALKQAADEANFYLSTKNLAEFKEMLASGVRSNIF
jgi:hypothetical protein